ncbi:MAG TPA: hypothetical protein VFR31_01125 [Thermoanaerobaculia bacterium]|nr:hypothetical protein [Thermoanaerobaculia bacterium]
MDKANVERIHLLLKRHEQMLDEKRLNPEEFLRQNEQFQEAFGRIARTTIVPVLEEIKDILVGKVESASIFHKRTAAGLRVKLDRWEDFERSVLFFGDASTQSVRVTHEGVGFGLLSQKLGLQHVTPDLVEEEAMKFLRRLFGQEQLRRPMHAPESPERRRPASAPAMIRGDYQLVRI